VVGWAFAEAGAVVGLASVAKTGLSGLATAPEAFGAAVVAAAELAETWWPTIKQIPVFR